MRISFCFELTMDDAELRSKIERKLGEVEFIELLISTIYTKARTGKKFDVRLVKELLVELEKIRVELEFRGYELAQNAKHQFVKK